MTTRVTHRYLIDLGDPVSSDSRLVGSKAARLAGLVRRGFDVPDGMVLTTNAFQDTVGVLPDPTEESVLALPLPEPVESALLKAIDRFGDTAVAVRSSGLAEDLSDSSFAGQYETVLGVRGPEELVDAIRRCWASAFSSHLAAYRREHRPQGAAPMAVLIQRLVDAAAAGVAFTADPVTGARDVIIVNAVRGRGDRLVSGEMTPEEWRISEDGSERTPADDPVLTEVQARAVAELARRIEADLEAPQDIEWALEGDRVRLLQARPITGLPEPVEPVPVPVEAPDGFWERDASHWPAPHSPLGRSIVYPIGNRVSPRFCSDFGVLAEKIVLTDIGGWHYVRVVPLGGKDRKAPPALVLGIMARLHPQIRKRLRVAVEAVRTDKARQYIDRWYEEWQPDLITRIDAFGAVDLLAMSDDQLLDHLASVLDLIEDGFLSHIFIHAAGMVENYGLAVSCRELLGWKDDKMLALLTGLSYRTSEPANNLARLARLAERRPNVLQLLTDITTETPERLAQTDPEFAAAFDAYRWSASGFRALSRDVADPTLADQPALLLQLLANQLSTGFDPAAVDATNGENRHDLVEEARAVLADRPADLHRFEEALERARRSYPLREDNIFYVQAPAGLIRYAALEMGRRMTERDQIEGPDDVFFLEYPELTSAFAARSDQHDLVRRRKGERAWVLAHPGPPSYGTPPGPPPSLKYLPTEVRRVTEAFFWTIDNSLDKGEAQDGVEGGIRGMPASPGSYRGTVRVIMNEDEFGKLQPGDVVVAPITQPTWSVLFPSMGAVVTDSGGILSHPAIIAREYRIPAVVATGNATNLLQDDQVVTVDGSTGVVTVDS